MQENEGRQRAPQVGEMALFFHLVGAHPLLRVELQEALDELLGGGADGIPPGAREGEGSLARLSNQGRIGRETAEKDVQHHAGAPHVDLQVSKSVRKQKKAEHR